MRSLACQLAATCWIVSTLGGKTALQLPLPVRLSESWAFAVDNYLLQSPLEIVYAVDET